MRLQEDVIFFAKPIKTPNVTIQMNTAVRPMPFENEICQRKLYLTLISF